MTWKRTSPTSCGWRTAAGPEAGGSPCSGRCRQPGPCGTQRAHRLRCGQGRIEKLNYVLSQFKAGLSADTLASLRVEVSLVVFNHEVKYVDFRSVEALRLPVLRANGATRISQAINTALDLIERRKQVLPRGRHISLPPHRRAAQRWQI